MLSPLGPWASGAMAGSDVCLGCAGLVTHTMDEVQGPDQEAGLEGAWPGLVPPSPPGPGPSRGHMPMPQGGWLGTGPTYEPLWSRDEGPIFSGSTNPGPHSPRSTVVGGGARQHRRLGPGEGVRASAPSPLSRDHSLWAYASHLRIKRKTQFRVQPCPGGHLGDRVLSFWNSCCWWAGAGRGGLWGAQGDPAPGGMPGLLFPPAKGTMGPQCASPDP